MKTSSTTRLISLSILLILFVLRTEIVSAQSTPVFSIQSGYYTQTQQLSISAQADEEIYYTLNGAIPNENSLKYSAPISLTDRKDQQPNISFISNISHSYSPWVSPTGPIQLINVVRARVKKGEIWGKTATASYIIDAKGAQRYTLPVISLSTDSVNLFDYNTGIYVLGKYYDEYKAANPSAKDGLETPANYTQRGDDWEKPAHLELFESNGERVLDMDMGIRMHGGGSRSFQQKSFRLYARKDYGPSRFTYKFFTDQPLTEYKRLILRNSGQDWMKTALRDGFMQTLVRHLPFETMAFRQSVLFLNGEFWGIANIRERYDDNYLSIKFGIPDNKIDYLSNNLVVEEGSATHYQAMLNYIKAGSLSNNARFEYIKTQMDTEGFTFYNLSNIFFNNRDWPHNNIEFWRLQTPYDTNAGPGKDGRWRWMLKDTDFGFAWTDIHKESTYLSQVTQNYLEQASRPDNWSTFLLYELLKNESFKQDFIHTYRDLMNTAFKETRVLSVLDSLKTVIEPYIQEHIDRWGNSDHRWSMPHDVAEWETNLEYMRRFAHDRETNVNQHFKDKFGLQDLYTVSVSVNDTSMGFVRVHYLDIKNGNVGVGDFQYPATWTGSYFAPTPLKITAIAKPGYSFSGWENHETGDSTLVLTEATAPIYAHFVKKGDVAIDKENEKQSLKTQLFPNYPNPFNPSTKIRFQISKTESVKISIYDTMGRLLFTQFEGVLGSGIHELNLEMSSFPSGVYFYQLKTGTQSFNRKMILMK